jgi:hypothetical protein
MNGLRLAVVVDLDTDRLASRKQDAPDVTVRHQGQVGTAVEHGIEVAIRRVLPDTVDVVHRQGPGAVGVRRVHIEVFGEAGELTCLDEGVVGRHPFVALVAADGDRTVRAVPLVLDVEVGLGLLEVWQHLVVRPLGVTILRPLVEVLRQAALEDRAVYGAAAADDLTPGDDLAHALRRELAIECPVVGVRRVIVVGQAAMSERGRVVVNGLEVWTGLHQQDFAVRVLR